MKTMLFSMTTVSALSLLAMVSGCDDRGFLGSTLPLPSGTGGESSTAGSSGSTGRGTGGSAKGGGGYAGDGSFGGEGGYAGEGGSTGEGGYGGYAGEGGYAGDGSFGGEGGYAGEGGYGGYAGEGGSAGDGSFGGEGGYAGEGGYGGYAGYGGYGGYAGDSGFGGYGGQGERLVPCPAPGSASTPVTIDAFRIAVTRKWVGCVSTLIGGEGADALGMHDEGIEIKADGRYWHIARNQAGDLEGITGVDSEGTITYGFTDFGAVQTTFRSDLNQILVAAPVITVSPTLLIIRTGDADHRFVPADGP